MLDMGFMPDIERILAVLPPVRQNLLFSATFSNEIKRLAEQFMRSPTMIEVARRNAPAELVTHQVFEVANAKKAALLAHLVRSRDMKQVLIFTRMKRDADRVARQLQKDGLPAVAIHSDRSQAERTQALDEFKQGKSAILVATDIAARGLDIDSLPFVINYELPHTPEDYVHRIGRTGRAGTPGEAISLVSPEEMEFLGRIEKLLKREIPRLATPTLEGASREREASRERSPQRERGAESERGTRRPPREERDTNRPPRQSHAKAATPSTRAPATNLPHFDFSKPYEPTAKASAVTAPTEPETGHRRHAKRPTGALLGGKRQQKAEE